MSDTLIKGVIRKATRTEWTRFSSVIITGVSTPDGEWVLYRPIADVVGQDEARMSLFNKIVPIQYEVNGNGMWLTGDFISKAAFYGCAMISERPELREFRDAVVKVIEQLASKGFSVPPNKSDSPLMRLAKENVQIVFEVEELQRRQAAVESEQIAIRKRSSRNRKRLNENRRHSSNSSTTTRQLGSSSSGSKNTGSTYRPRRRQTDNRPTVIPGWSSGASPWSWATTPTSIPRRFTAPGQRESGRFRSWIASARSGSRGLGLTVMIEGRGFLDITMFISHRKNGRHSAWIASRRQRGVVICATR
jgi:hypothetical protein